MENPQGETYTKAPDEKKQHSQVDAHRVSPAQGMATIHDDDERLLARIGYRQVGHTTFMGVIRY